MSWLAWAAAAVGGFVLGWTWRGIFDNRVRGFRVIERGDLLGFGGRVVRVKSLSYRTNVITVEEIPLEED
jgi:hypothetical protein